VVVSWLFAVHKSLSSTLPAFMFLYYKETQDIKVISEYFIVINAIYYGVEIIYCITCICVLFVQLLREFQRYKELIKRPSVSKELVSERYSKLSFFTYIFEMLLNRETLLGQLLSFIKSVKEEFTSCTASGRRGRHAAGPPTGKNLPEVVNNIVWGRELEAKVSKTFVMHYCKFSHLYIVTL